MTVVAFEQWVLAAWPLDRWRDTRQLLAVSGGADSVAMLRAILAVAAGGDRIDVAHFNHGWRGAESDGDEAWVRELCSVLGVRLFVGRSAEVDDGSKSEERARESRYAFLTETAYHCGARYVLTAHTASDRVETLLHNLLRGTGLAGAAAPVCVRNLHRELVLVRPLLGVTRSAVEDYLSSITQDFRLDTSNQNLDYRRNFVRHALLPLLRDQFGLHVDERLLSFSEHVGEAVETIRELADQYAKQVDALRTAEGIQGCSHSIAFPSAQKTRAAWPIVRAYLHGRWIELGWPLQGMSRKHWEVVRDLYERANCAKDSRQDSLPGGLTILRSDRGWITVARPE